MGDGGKQAAHDATPKVGEKMNMKRDN